MLDVVYKMGGRIIGTLRYLGVIEYYLGAAGVRTSAILTSYTLQVCSYTPQISPLAKPLEYLLLSDLFKCLCTMHAEIQHYCFQ